jgi:CBS domain-containing protein
MEALVDSIMRTKPATVDPDTTVTKAAGIIAKMSDDCLIVSKDSLVVGIVTSTDMIDKVIAVGANPEKVYVRDIMSTPVVTVNLTASIKRAAEVMSDYGVRKLPVIDGSGGLAGVITSLELARWLAKISDFQDPALNALAKHKEGDQGGPYR